MALSFLFIRTARSWQPSATRRFSSSSSPAHDHDEYLFADASISFASMGVTSPILLSRLEALGHKQPTAVQAAAFGAIASQSSNKQQDVTIGAETGSGKTLAYLLPIMNDILIRKQEQPLMSYDYARALILVPNKELVQQVLRMAQSLAGGGTNLADGDHDESTIVRLATLPGGLRDPLDFRPFRDSIGLGGKQPPVDIVISTPASVGPWGLKPMHINMFADIQTLVVDEADMLLDGGYLRPLENVLMGFRRADRLMESPVVTDLQQQQGDDNKDTTSSSLLLGSRKTQHVFVAATLPDSGLRSVDAYLVKKFPYALRVTMKGMHSARHYGLKEKTVWYEMNEKKERLQQLLQLLETPPPSNNNDGNEGVGGLANQKIMVFVNTVEDADNVNEALQRANVRSLAYHAKIPIDERSVTLDRFRRFDSNNSNDDDDTVNVLVSTDLGARGIDVPGVNVVVQLQFAGNVVAHLHRMGRCSRAGQRNGRGIVFYGEQEQDLIKVVQTAEEEQETMVLVQDVDFDASDNIDGEGSSSSSSGTVQKAFSRKRGFTKKRKKLQRESEMQSSNNDTMY